MYIPKLSSVKLNYIRHDFMEKRIFKPFSIKLKNILSWLRLLNSPHNRTHTHKHTFIHPNTHTYEHFQRIPYHFPYFPILWICLSPHDHYVNLKLCRHERKLTLPAPFISESGIKIKVNLNFYFHTSLWCLKSFYEGL